MRNRIQQSKALICGGLLLIAAALCLVLYNIRDARRAEQSARLALAELTELMQATPETAANGADEAPDPNREMPAVTVGQEQYIGTLELPTLGLELPVISEWSEARLKNAPCRYAGSAYQDNMIVAGHNYRQHFGRLDRLTVGDAVVFTDAENARFPYIVTEIERLPGTAVEEMEAGDWDLTLFTCTLDGRSRITVRCKKAEK